jgi:hypothetical protein
VGELNSKWPRRSLSPPPECKILGYLI